MKKTTKRNLIYVRYIFPVFMAAAFIILMLMPCYRFKDADGLRTSVSLFGLMGNSWNTVREYIFGAGQTQAVTLDFAWTVMISLVCLCIAFILGAAVCIYSLVAALGYFKSGLASGTRLMFVTLTANRVLLCILQGLMLPVFLLPSILVYFYRSILLYEVTAEYTPFNLLYIALALYVIMIALTVVSKRHEMLCDMNIYTKKRTEPKENITLDGDKNTEEEKDADAYTLMSERAREEQAERIRRLLNKTDGNEEEK